MRHIQARILVFIAILSMIGVPELAVARNLVYWLALWCSALAVIAGIIAWRLTTPKKGKGEALPSLGRTARIMSRVMIAIFLFFGAIGTVLDLIIPQQRKSEVADWVSLFAFACIVIAGVIVLSVLGRPEESVDPLPEDACSTSRQ